MAQQQSEPQVVQWILDTRPLFPEAQETRQLETHAGASRALALLTPDERAGVLRYYYVRDAKMALVSHLMKHYAVTRFCGVPWWQTTIVRDARTKPVYRDPGTGKCPLAFNVSHQAGLVAMAAVPGYPLEGEGDGEAEVGVDVVCTSERRDRDHRMVASEGWARFVDTHAEVFADAEVNYLKYQVAPPPGAAPAEVLDYRLRCFYTLWCLREAYVKMTGDALLADWLKALEFRKFVPPALAEESVQGDKETIHDIFFRKNPVRDANVCIRALGSDYMICTALRTVPKAEDGLAMTLWPYKMLDLEEILNFAEASIK